MDVAEKDICSYCGNEWETDPDELGIPMCCEIAQDEWARDFGGNLHGDWENFSAEVA